MGILYKIFFSPFFKYMIDRSNVESRENRREDKALLSPLFFFQTYWVLLSIKYLEKKEEISESKLALSKIIERRDIIK